MSSRLEATGRLWLDIAFYGRCQVPLPATSVQEVPKDRLVFSVPLVSRDYDREDRVFSGVDLPVGRVTAATILEQIPSLECIRVKSERLESVAMQKHFDTGSMVVIVITFVCFAIALFAKGLTQALLLEIGVLLVSVKLIIMAFKSSMANEEIVAELRAIRDLLES